MLVKIIFVFSFIFVPFLLSFVINFFYLRFFKKIKRKKGQLGKILKSNFLKKIYWEFPKDLIVANLLSTFEEIPNKFF